MVAFLQNDQYESVCLLQWMMFRVLLVIGSSEERIRGRQLKGTKLTLFFLDVTNIRAIISAWPPRFDRGSASMNSFIVVYLREIRQ